MIWTAFRALLAVGAMAPLLASAEPLPQTPPPAFQTPSGNIHCLFREGRMRCDVQERSYTPPPRPPGCRDDWGSSLALGARGPARLLCVRRPLRDEEAFVLGYGARWIGRAIACESDEAGLSCTNREGRGFRVSRTRLELF
ncbi:DUF6636 domain-containing protein [Rubritepida flocculans]|uniref:DUF6636 domain-containing protein n=1 Tax=Rubritepida flocculans TaxID=182403 RepID=UPI0012EB360C|nr:DUF6636 domain-containing protein [Rubritepida flocculans]